MSFSASSTSGIGRMGIIVSESGTHSPEKWAENCVAKLVEIPDDVAGDRRQEAINFKERVYHALVRHHQIVQSNVIHELLTASENHFSSDQLFIPGQELDSAVEEVLACATGSLWESDFRDHDNVELIRFFIGHSFVDLRHLERVYFAEMNPQNLWAAAYAHKYGTYSVTQESV